MAPPGPPAVPGAQPPCGANPWGQPPDVPPLRHRSAGSPWVVALTISLAVVVLAFVGVALWAAGRQSSGQGTIEVPSRLVPLPSTSAPTTTLPSTGTQPAGPSTTAPGSTGGPTTVLDTATPKVRMTDIDGRFGVTVPRSWVNVPADEPDTLQLRLFEQAVDGTVTPSDHLFVVRWFPSNGCALADCVAEHVSRLKSVNPTIRITSTADTVAGIPGARLDADLGARLNGQRLVGWVVVQDDRYWAMELVGPPAGFGDVLSVTDPVVATMSFG